MCEEVQKPATQVPIAMIWTILLNTVCGFIFLVPLVFVLPSLAAVVNDPSGQPLPVILRSAIGSEGGKTSSEYGGLLRHMLTSEPSGI